ncbi:glycoside hydrolase family 64 protein [Streptomyces beihaiensis]|uniref:Glycoside hydrolase family 64 protein n=1 Tax=Streptomyces beihaiensis TaxID=2984495 RepID=A0ABT3TNK3_9ACTN|nr:glycoside hydrolase family 64 protein [Streptomyces beihaiensis]MCX3058596.1 glycoside hydrolase family 64 protein [Streptomyces beihaiensis]
MISRRALLAGAGASAATAAAVLAAPSWTAAATPATCQLALVNTSLPGSVRAYVTGHDRATGALQLLRADGSVYRPASPGTPMTPLPVDCAIPLGAAGSAAKVVTLPQMYGSRIYFVRDDTLDFFLNPGPALVEPAFATPSDPNYGKTWSFCEFTFDSSQLYANISYVDLVTALPIGLTLEGDATHTVAPLPDGAVDKIASALVAQAAEDGLPWDELVVRGADGGVLRAVSPQNIMAPYFGQPDRMPFRDMWTDYVDRVWQKYGSTGLTIDLQGGRGTFTGRVSGDTLVFDGGYTFGKPSSKDIFTCNYGPFANDPGDPDDKKGILARLAAGFNRSLMLTHTEQPDGVTSADYYQDATTNHWARIVHANSPIGYAFPYDDVQADGQPDVSGAAHDGNPRRFTVSVGS